MSSSPTPQNTHSPPHPLLASCSSSASIPASPPQEANIPAVTAEGSTTVTSPSHGASLSTGINTPAPPSISGSTATGTTATTMTSTTMVSASGASSTSSPPPLFPPLVTHAPPQLSVTNANAHGPAPLHPPNQAHNQAHTNCHPAPSTTTSGGGGGPSRSTSSHPQLPPGRGISTPRQIEEARRAVVASISNLVDRELTGRAVQLHSNNAAIEKQEREISRTLDAFRKDNDKLAKLAAEHTKKIKEIGNVQNWAEMLERDFLILEETLRLANRRRGDGEEEEDSASWSGSGSYSGSWSGSEAGDGPPEERGDVGKETERTAGEGEGEGVNGAIIKTTLPQGEQDSRVPDGGGQTQGDTSAMSTAKAPVLLGKGKEREGDIQLALAEAMETDLVIGAGAGSESGPSSSR